MVKRFGQMVPKTKINKKMSSLELMTIYSHINFFDFNNMESINQKGCIVKFCKNIDQVIYSDYDKKKKKIYQRKELILQQVIKGLFDFLLEEECLILKYEKHWIKRRKESKKIYNILRNNRIKNKETCGINVNKTSVIVFLFVQAIMRYNAFVSFVFEKNKIVFVPTDHMDIFIYYNNDKYFGKIERLVQEFNKNSMVLEVCDLP